MSFQPEDRRNVQVVALSYLPAPVRLAYVERECATAGLPAGTYDEAAHLLLMAAPATVRAEAERKAVIVRFIRAGRAAGHRRGDIHRAVWQAFGDAGNSTKSLGRWEKQAQGVDVVNLAPALMDRYTGGVPHADMHPEAWAMFEGGSKVAFKTHRVTALYHDIAKLARQSGWAWPSYSTVLRRLKQLPVAEQIALREGREAATRKLYQHQRRNPAETALAWVVLDGRTLDVWVTWTDGSVIRPTVLGLVDQASGKVLDLEFARAETPEATAVLVRRVVARHGAPDNLLTDNSTAFSGHQIAGRVGHKFRNKGNRRRDLEPPGLHIHLGFNLHFATPKNGQAKLMERKFADFSREIDTCPEFARAHAGSHPGEKPEGRIVPIALADLEAVYRSKVANYNARGGRRSQGCKLSGTDSYDAAFVILSRGRARKVLSEAQLYLATLEWSLTTVQRDGTVRGKDGWEYGNDVLDGSQDKLIRFEGRKVWVGTNPLDRSQPALVWNPKTDRIIAYGVQPVRRGAFDDAEGARKAARAKAHARGLSRRVDDINEKAAIAALRGLLEPGGAKPAAPAETVVQPHFGGTIRPPRDDDATAGELLTLKPTKSFITEEMRANQRRAAQSGRDG